MVIRIGQEQSRCPARNIRGTLNAMTETKPKRRWFRFSIRDLLLSFIVIALALGWWVDHLRIARLEATKWEYDYGLFDSDQNHLPDTILKFNKMGENGWYDFRFFNIVMRFKTGGLTAMSQNV